MKFIEEDYLKSLSEQIYFLRNSCEQYDKGYYSEGKRIAATIRLLVHDTKSSISLLNHLNVKTKLYYFNTAIPNTKFGLTGIRTTSEGNGKTEYYPPLNNLSEPRKQRSWVTFETWWEDMMVLSDGKNNFSRKDLVTTLANKDGGSHVDKKLPENYYELTRKNSLKVYHIEEYNKVTNVQGIELASLRQIAFELLNSLNNTFPEYFS